MLVEALTTISDLSLTTYKATRTLTESVNTVIYDSSFVTNTKFYTTHSLFMTGVETHVPQSSFISSNLDTSMQTSLLAKNSSVSMDLMSNNTAVTVSDTTAGSFESASITAGISTTAFDSATSNIGFINSLITHSSIVTTPLFYTTDKFSATEVETALLHSGIISSDFVTSMPASLLAKNSSVSMDLMSNNTTATSIEDASTTTAILKTAFDSATSNTASIDSLIIHSSIATTPLFYATDKLSATEVETAQLQSGIISSDFVTSVAASLFADNSSIPTDFMNNKTAVNVSDTTTESFEGVSTTDGILTTEYDSTKSNTVSINDVLSLRYTVTTPLFYTTDLSPATQVEKPVLQSSFISADTGTSMPSLNIAEEARASTDIISIETVVTVSDTTTVSFVTTTADILSTSFDFTLELSRTFQSTNAPVMTSIETNDIHLDTKSYMSSSALFYLSTDIPGMFSESDYDINVTSVNTYIPSTVMVVSASTDTSPLTPGYLSIMGSQTTINTTEVITLSSNMLSITSLSPSFVLQLSVCSQSTVRPQSISSSVTSSIDTYLTTPNGNNEQVTTPIQSAFSENFIIISASVAGVIIIVFGSLMVLYWLNKLPRQQRHKSNELHRDKLDNISWNSLSPNNYMHNESYSGRVYQYSHIPLRLTSRYNMPYSYDHSIYYQNNWNNI